MKTFKITQLNLFTIFFILIMIPILSQKILSEEPNKERKKMIMLPKETIVADKNQMFIYHKGDKFQICRFESFVFIEPLLVLKGESSHSLIKEIDTVDSRIVDNRGVYVKLSLLSKVYDDEKTAKKEAKGVKFDLAEEIIISVETFNSFNFSLLPFKSE